MYRTSSHVTAAFLLSLVFTLTAGASQPAVPATPDKSAATAAVEQSVLERFRTASGQRTAEGLLRLFTPLTETDNLHQKPEVAHSDGKTTVELTVTMTGSAGSATNFACIEGRLISSKQTQENVWQLVVLPDAGSWKTAVIIKQGDVTKTVALAVTPPLQDGTDLSVKTFSSYLQNSESDPTQRIDLNGDGVFDFQDDYIYAANVLAAKNANPHDPATRNKRARELTPVRPKP